MIVVYHIFSFCIYPQDKGTHPIYKAIWLPLHIGVVLFILISGYFRIKPSVKGMVRLLSYMFIYTVPFGLIYHVAESGGGIKRVCETFLFISHSPFWFMRTYIMLYISAPVLNWIIEESGSKQILKLITILSVIAIYFGMSHFDMSVISGKNVVLFSLIYVIGACIDRYELWKRWNKWTYLGYFLLINLIEVMIYTFLSGNIIGEGFFYLCFQYCSPILIFNGIMVFCFALNFDFRSKVVNWFAKSALAIYLLHLQIMGCLIAPVANRVLHHNASPSFVIPMIFLLGTVLSVSCVLFDKILTPVFHMCNLAVPLIEKSLRKIQLRIFQMAEDKIN